MSNHTIKTFGHISNHTSCQYIFRVITNFLKILKKLKMKKWAFFNKKHPIFNHFLHSKTSVSTLDGLFKKISSTSFPSNSIGKANFIDFNG